DVGRLTAPKLKPPANGLIDLAVEDALLDAHAGMAGLEFGDGGLDDGALGLRRERVGETERVRRRCGEPEPVAKHHRQQPGEGDANQSWPGRAHVRWLKAVRI